MKLMRNVLRLRFNRERKNYNITGVTCFISLTPGLENDPRIFYLTTFCVFVSSFFIVALGSYKFAEITKSGGVGEVGLWPQFTLLWNVFFGRLPFPTYKLPISNLPNDFMCQKWIETWLPNNFDVFRYNLCFSWKPFQKCFFFKSVFCLLFLLKHCLMTWQRTTVLYT